LLTKNQIYEAFIIACILTGVLTFSISLIVLSASSQQPRPDVVNIIVEATVQLLGFGGVVFAVIFQAQRSLLSKLRSRKNQLNQFVMADIFKSITATSDQATIDKQKRAREELTELERVIPKVADTYFFVRNSFFLAFSSLAVSLIIELIHRVGFNVTIITQVSTSTLGNILFSAEISLIAVAVVGFLSALIISTTLPLEPS